MSRLRVRVREPGVALVTALVFMLVVLMMGVAAARSAIHAGKSARYERDRHIAFAAAEAALVDAEGDIESAAVTSPGRASLFDAGPSALAKGCGRGMDDLGLCLDEGGAPQWQAADLEAEDATVGYGGFTGARMATGGATLPARAPRYIIEFIHVGGAPPGTGRFFRITAIGFGSRKATQVVLQSFYRKAPAGGSNGSSGGSGPRHRDETEGRAPPVTTPPPVSALPAGRIGWREIANWPELHQAAIK